MKLARLLIGPLLVIVLLAMTPTFVKAEFMIDIYGGGSFSQDEQATIEVSGFGLVLRGRGDVDYDESFLAGGRIGYWSESVPYIGFALDGSFFQPDIDLGGAILGVDVYPLSALLMGRIPFLKDSEFPKGAVQLYAGAGPSLFITEAEIDVSLPGFPWVIRLEDKTTEVGVDLRAGCAILLHKNFALFGEYRFTYFETEFEDNLLGLNIGLDTKFNTHHILGGISFRF